MRAAKLKKSKKNEKVDVIKEEYTFKQLMLILLVVGSIFIAFYFITILVLNNKRENLVYDNNWVETDSSKITFSNLLNRNQNEYYVLASYSKVENDKADYNDIYDLYISKYEQKEENINIYYIDLSDALNKNYIGNNMNITNDLNKLKVNEEVLFKIKNKKIENTYVGRKNIIDKLSRL